MSYAYTPTSWKNGDIITQERLNKIENGVNLLSKMYFEDITEIPSGGIDFTSINPEFDAILIVTSKDSSSTLLGLYHYDATNGGGFTQIHKGNNISITVGTNAGSYASYHVTKSSSATQPAYLSTIVLHAKSAFD